MKIDLALTVLFRDREPRRRNTIHLHRSAGELGGQRKTGCGLKTWRVNDEDDGDDEDDDQN